MSRAALRGASAQVKLFIWAIGIGSWACTAARVYPLPLDAERAHQTLEPIAHVAAELGLETEVGPDAVRVHLDGGDRVAFVVGASGYEMRVTVNERGAPAGELDERYLRAHRLGNDIWARALASMADR